MNHSPNMIPAYRIGQATGYGRWRVVFDEQDACERAFDAWMARLATASASPAEPPESPQRK